jgi:hypothetical protein
MARRPSFLFDHRPGLHNSLYPCAWSAFRSMSFADTLLLSNITLNGPQLLPILLYCSLECCYTGRPSSIMPASPFRSPPYVQLTPPRPSILSRPDSASFLGSHAVAALDMVMVVFHEEVLVGAVSGESNSCNAQAGEGALESVPPAELSCVPPALTIPIVSTKFRAICTESGYTDALSQGSYRGWPAAAANFRGSKPVMFGFSPWWASNLLSLY